jgi:hypothetical protein
MAHFAKIENGVVTEVIVVANEDCGNLDFPESEPIGQGFLRSCGFTGTYKQTSYNANFRKVYAGIGYTYNEELDVFMPPKPHPSWIYDEESGGWKAPVAAPEPEDDVFYKWHEQKRKWIKHSMDGYVDGQEPLPHDDVPDINTQYVGGGEGGDDDETLATKKYDGMPS